MKYVIETLEIERAKVKHVIRNIERNCHEFCDSFTEAFSVWNGRLAELEAASLLLANVEKPNAPQHGQPATAPLVVCLCGSTRFSEAFREANFKETLAGRIVLSIGCDFKSDAALGLTDSDKSRLDELHKRKIDLANEVLILNVGGYIGESTRSELNYAVAHGKRVRYLEPQQA